MNFIDIFQEYSINGYAKIGNVLDSDLSQSILKEIKNSKDTVTYFDNKNIIRRIEKVYNKGNKLNQLNNKILDILYNIFSEKYIIFKDKYNAKPPGGEGFYPHYDGIFNWENQQGEIKDGWYEYCPEFINVLVALDDTNDLNGTIEVAKIDNSSFDTLISKTKKNGTPEILEDIAKTLEFEKINLNRGDGVIFSHKCPHRSAINKTNKSRRIIYYTYNSLKYGDNYNNYFEDKLTSNPEKKIHKALSSK